MNHNRLKSLEWFRAEPLEKLVTAVAAAVIAFTGVAQAKDWGKGSTVRIATEGAYAPWNHKDSSGKLVDFEIDLAADLCKRMKMKCEMIERLWKGTIAALRAGEFDAIMTSVTITEKRKNPLPSRALTPPRRRSSLSSRTDHSPTFRPRSIRSRWTALTPPRRPLSPR